jgi:hypothetical protein
MNSNAKKQLTLYVAPWGKEWIVHMESQPPISIYETKAQAIAAAKKLTSPALQKGYAQIIVRRRKAYSENYK